VRTSEPFTVLDLQRITLLRFEGDLRDRWFQAERQWRDVENELRGIVAHSRDEFGDAAIHVAERLREAYRELRQALESR
jgi:hypothetical protein